MCKFSFDWTYTSTPQHHFEGRAVFAGCAVRAVGTTELPAALGKSEFGVCGVVGGMMVIELLAGMRRGRRKMFARIEEFTSETIAGNAIADNLSSALDSFERGETVSFDQAKISELRTESLSWLKSALN